MFLENIYVLGSLYVFYHLGLAKNSMVDEIGSIRETQSHLANKQPELKPRLVYAHITKPCSLPLR